MKFYIVDAFAEELFGGNPAGVVILEAGKDFPEDKIMVKVAAELRYSETAFIQQSSEHEWKARYFTPTEEVDLCGHATIGAFGALLAENLVEEGKHYRLMTHAGILEIEIRKGLVFMEMGQPIEMEQAPDAGQIAEVLGIDVGQLGMAPGIVSTGLPDIMVHVKNKETLLGMQPDYGAMAALSSALQVVGIHAFSLSESLEITAICRNFAPLYGIDEEAATGTANGALTYYLYNRGLVKPGELNTFLQGESLGRPSKIFSSLDERETVKIRVGGSHKILAKGKIFI